MSAAGHGPLLIIGYGSTLRGDDGAGAEVARLLAEYQFPLVQIHEVTQLMPELAAPIATARAVIFIDAKSTPEAVGVTMELVEPSVINVNLAHAITPPDILRLAIECFGRAAPSWLVAVAGRDFRFTRTLSDYAQANVTTAARVIKDHIDGLLCEEVPLTA